MNLPTLLSENQIRSFSYYWQGEVRLGMSTSGHLYALLDCFGEDKRAIAYEKGCQLASEHDVVLTVSQGNHPQYRLWISLSSKTNLAMLIRAGVCDSDTSACHNSLTASKMA
ncbi:MAG: hypothetical protein F6K42_15705 [Leptolyngbya sp. SIO1D8]|nr:hypothetical protein [Leptolyngbya sp. SIO1D8]